MKVERCYCCNEPLADANASVEHIIPNSCGGRLKSSKLLCVTCNSTFGNNFDKELAETVNPIANLLIIERERGEPQKIRSTGVDSGKQYDLHYDGEISLSAPEIHLVNMESENLEERRIKVRAPNQKILDQTFRGLKRKYPQLNIQDAIEKANTTRAPFDEEVEIKASIGGTETFKSIVKTAINFYIYHGGERKYIEHLLPYLMGETTLNVVWFYYPETPPFIAKDQEVTHVLKLVGNPKERVLYAYVELFNIHCFIVSLCSEYDGGAIDKDYIFNVHTLSVIDDGVTLSIVRRYLLDIFFEQRIKGVFRTCPRPVCSSA